MTQLTSRTRKRLLTGAAAAALAVNLSSPAFAGDLTLDFDDLGYTFFGAGDQFEYKGLQFSTQSGLSEGQAGDLVGAIFDGRDTAMCMRLVCPVNNYTPGYFAGLNDGALVIDSAQPGGLQIKSFDASFIGSFEVQYPYVYYPPVAGLLEIRGYSADGSFISERFQLEGNRGADFYMQHYETSASFASHSFSEIAIFAYSCNFNGDCVAFDNNAGQFALDNVNMQISAVPEPASWMLLLGGFGTIAAYRRRKAA